MWKYCDILVRMGPRSSYLRIFILIIYIGQVAPCSTEVSQSDDGCMVCNNQCPNGFYQVQQCSTTTAATTTLSTESTQTTSTLAPSSPVSNETDGVPDTTTGASRVQVFNETVNETLICRRCNKQSPSAVCPTQENPDTGNQVAIIAGSVAGGVVLVAIVVLLVVLWWCRRKRSKGATEMVEEPPPEMSGGLRHDSSADLVTQRDKSQGDPTYENFHHKRPTNSSIQIGHDNVTRYTRDPTLKRELLNRSNPEDKELEELGEAPLPPGAQEAYEDTESRSDQSVSRRGRDPLPPVPGEHRPPFSSQRNRPVTGQDKRGVKAEVAKKQVKVEEDDPDEDYINVEKPATGKNTPSTVKGTLPPVPTAHKGGDVDKVEDDDSSPDESYENVGAKKTLTKKKRNEGNARSGRVNPAVVDDDEEPEEMYGNQDVVEEQRRQSRPHKPARNNTTTTPTTTTTKGGNDIYIAMDLLRAPKDEDDEVQPVYGNDANENPYVNLPLGSKGGYS